MSNVADIEAAVENTVKNPGVDSVINDIKLALDLFAEFKAKTAGLHPSVLDIIKILI